MAARRRRRSYDTHDEVEFYALIVLLALVAGACAAGRSRRSRPTGTLEPDKFLFERGTENLNRKRWLVAREYFRQLVDSYPQSQYRADAKLGIGDTYLGEHSAESFVLGDQRVPRVPQLLSDARARALRAVQAGDGATSTRCARRCATRRRRATRSASCRPTCHAYPGQAADRRRAGEAARGEGPPGATGTSGVAHPLLPHQVVSGRRRPPRPAAEGRIPEYTRRDAAYYYLGETMLKIQRPAEALPYFERLVKEFETERVSREGPAADHRAEEHGPAPPGRTPRERERQDRDLNVALTLWIDAAGTVGGAAASIGEQMACAPMGLAGSAGPLDARPGRPGHGRIMFGPGETAGHQRRHGERGASAGSVYFVRR